MVKYIQIQIITIWRSNTKKTIKIRLLKPLYIMHRLLKPRFYIKNNILFKRIMSKETNYHDKHIK